MSGSLGVASESFRMTDHVFVRWQQRVGTGFDEMVESLSRSVRLSTSKVLGILQSRRMPAFRIREYTEYWFDEKVGVLFIVSTSKPPGKMVVTVFKFRRKR